jgi:hypothetical protein
MYDEGIPSVIAPIIDEDSTPYLSYDVDDGEEVIEQKSLVSQDQLLVKEEHVV